MADKTPVKAIYTGDDVTALGEFESGDTIPISMLSGVAAASHNHSGTYEPADATILKDADIGVSVAAKSHGHAIADVTGLQTALDGKQPTGSYLTANQTITLTGDATGSGTTSIAVTVVDDSHNHIIANVDGLQTALDGKQAADADLTTLAGLAKTDGNFIVGNGSAWVAESGATARASLGLGTAAVANTGTSGATVPLLNTANTHSAKQTFSAGIAETWSALSGTTPSITAGNHTWTLSGNSTPTDGLADGDSCTLMIDDGSAYTITWTSIVDTWMNGGTAPTLATTGYTGVVLWKVGTSVYAMEVPQ